MKNKNLIIAAVIVILILLLGAGGYFMLGKNASKTPSTGITDTKKTNPEQASKSLLDLVTMGQNLRCTFTTSLTNGSTDGTVYVSGQNLRGDFTVKTSDGKQMQTSMIKQGDTSYIWGSSMTGGIKMTLSFDKLTENSQASQYVNPNQKLNYSCSPWSVDSSLFTVPTNIKFTDMTNIAIPKTNVTGTPTGTTNPCASITDPTTKTACENALKQSGQ